MSVNQITPNASVTTVPDLLGPILSQWWLVGAAAIVFGALTTGASYFVIPMYESTIVIGPVNHSDGAAAGTSGGLAQLGSLVGLGGLTQADFVRDSVGVLRSRSLIERYVAENDLIPKLFPEEVSKSDPPSMSIAVSKFQQDILTIAEEKLSGLIRLSIRSDDPAVAADWANGFVALANEAIRERTKQEAERTNEYLRRELDVATSIELRQAIYQLLESNIKTAMLANTRDDFAFVVIDPASVADEEERVWPNRVLFLLLGMFLGASLASVWLVVVELRSEKNGLLPGAREGS